MADRPVQEILKEALALSATRVIDLFKEWDEDGDGTVSKKEFRKAVPMLGLDPVPSKADIDALFDQWDPDGSGNIDYKELNKILRKSAEGLDTSLQAGGAGKIEMDSKAKTALRKGPNLQRGSSLAKVDIDEGSDKSIAEQLRTILSKNAVRRESSKYSQSKYSYSAMRRQPVSMAVRHVGGRTYQVRVIDLFREWDEDGDGTVSKKEFRKAATHAYP
jgi:Ca2+-binding EF-hand superfamily protein